MPLSAGQILNNRYRINALLSAASPTGAVYHAWDLTLNMAVAVKEYLAISSSAAGQFDMEARQLAILRHPNLPYVVDHFSLPGQGQYLVTEFIEGRDIQTMIGGKDRRSAAEQRRQAGSPASVLLPEAQVLGWFAQVCDAVGYLHAQSPAILHRDIRPANIKMTASGRAVLVDFGIAKAFPSAPSSTLVGGSTSQGFTAPEQYDGMADLRSDIYALGATLYAALTGEIPADSVQRQMGQSILPPRQLNPALTPRTEAAIMRAMQLDPAMRFQSVAELIAALGLPLGGAPPGGLAAQFAPGGSESGGPPAGPSAASRSWIIWAIVAFLALCLVGSVLAGIIVYSLFILPGQPTPTQLGLELSQTPLEGLLGSPSPSPSMTILPPPAATITSIVIPSVTTGPLASPTPSLTLPPNLTPTLTVTTAAPTWQPCPGTYPSRLHVGDQATVSFDPPLANRVRRQPNTQSVVLGFLQPGERMEILEGPVCYNNWIWWRVRSLETDLTGWTVEGDSASYWLVPYP